MSGKYETSFIESELILAASANDDAHIEERLRDPDAFPTEQSLALFARIVDRLSEAVYEEQMRRQRESQP